MGKDARDDELDFTHAVRGITAFVRDHGLRGHAYASENGLLRLGRMASPWVLHEIGACLAFQQMIVDGTIKSLVPHYPGSAAFYGFKVRLLARCLYRPTPHMQATPMGALGWGIVCFRFSHEDFWDGCVNQGGGVFDASDLMTDDAVHALAELIWAKRNVSPN